MRRLKSSIVQQTTRPIVALAFMPARPGSCRASSLFYNQTAYSPTGNPTCRPPRLLPTIPQTHPSPETTLPRPSRLLSHSLRPRSRPLFPLSPHRTLGPGISPTNCRATILLPSCLLPDARSPALAASGQFPIFGPIVLRQNLQTQNHIPFPGQNRKNSLANLFV